MSEMVNYNRLVSVPIRDTHYRDFPIVFWVDVYGVTMSDICTIGGGIGSKPLRQAVIRMGLDPDRYQASIWDVTKRR